MTTPTTDRRSNRIQMRTFWAQASWTSTGSYQPSKRNKLPSWITGNESLDAGGQAWLLTSWAVVTISKPSKVRICRSKLRPRTSTTSRQRYRSWLTLQSTKQFANRLRAILIKVTTIRRSAWRCNQRRCWRRRRSFFRLRRLWSKAIAWRLSIGTITRS